MSSVSSRVVARLTVDSAEGGDLQQYAVKHPQGLSVCTARIAFRQVMKALCCLHEQGIVHRDLKVRAIEEWELDFMT